MITVFSLMKRRPKAQVRPNRKSRAMAPRAQDLMEEFTNNLKNDLDHNLAYFFNKYTLHIPFGKQSSTYCSSLNSLNIIQATGVRFEG